MKNPALPLLAIVLLGVVAWMLWGGEPEDNLGIVNENPVVERDDRDANPVDANARPSDDPSGESAARSAIAGQDDDEDDPVYRRALAGFRGRLVFTSGKPAPGKSVRFYRADPELIQNPAVFSEQGVMEPRLEFYDATTSNDGKFIVRGVWPQAFYLMVADMAGENRSLSVLEKTPGPGEVVDLGDIELLDLGKIVGRVVDADGEPAVDALVRAIDLPGAILDFAPIERFDPEGGFIVDERGTQVVVTMPPYAKTVFDLLPIPATRTDADGNFVLLSVQPGMNSVIVNLPEHAALVKKGLRVRPGKECKAGRISMREGEIGEGTVVDSEDRPVVGAEVLVATKTAGMPAHFGSFAKATDEKGEFSMSGLARGPVYVAVRRSKEEAWTIVGPQSVAADLDVKLPGYHKLTVTIKTESGAPAKDVEFKMAAIAGGSGGPGLDFATLGMVSFIGLDGKISRTETGQYVFSDLLPGDYSLAIRAKGHAAMKLEVKLIGDVEETALLKPALGLDVVALDSNEEPVRNVKIYSAARGDRSRRVQSLWNVVGKTGRDGKVRIEDCEAGEMRISASHPAYGSYHVTVNLPSEQPAVFTLQEAGVITGVLLDGGKPPKPGKWTVSVNRTGPGARGAIETVPRLAAPDLEGRFRVNGLAPGKYRVQHFPSLSIISSPAGVMQMVQASAMDVRQFRRDVYQVTSGGETHVQLDASSHREVTGPSANISGTVMINGNPATGMVVGGWSEQGNLHAEVAENGRFDLGRVGVGHVQLRLRPSPASRINTFELLDGELWSYSVKVEEGKDLQLDLNFNTSSLSGTVLTAAGDPARSVELYANGSIRGQLDQPKAQSSARVMGLTDKNGRFEFKNLVAGDYHISVRSEHGYGRSEKLTLQPGVPLSNVRVQLERVYSIRGKVDLSVFKDSPDYIYLYLNSKRGGSSRGSRVDLKTGEFTVNALPKGSYSAQVHSWGDGANRSRMGFGTQRVEVDGDMTDVKITPTFDPPGRR